MRSMGAMRAVAGMAEMKPAWEISQVDRGSGAG